MDLGRLFRDRRPDAIMVATSFNGVDLEKTLIRLAREAGVPSLALVDFWSHYRERFSDSAGELSCLPDRIAVMDEQSNRAMMAEGFDPARLTVTGQPAVDAARAARAPRRLRALARRRWQATPRTFVALYASQPGRFDHQSQLGPDRRRAALAMLVRGLSIFARERRRQVLLVLRPHPRERYAPRTWGRRMVTTRSDARSPKSAATLGCDAMFGQRTMLLVEACALGIPAFSVQPLLAQAAGGGVPQVRTVTALLRSLHKAAARLPRPPVRLGSTAADRVVASLLDLIGLERVADA